MIREEENMTVGHNPDKSITATNVYFSSSLDRLAREPFFDFHFRFLKVKPRGKEAVEKNWQTVANYAISDSGIQDWTLHGGNYGLTCPSGFCCLGTSRISLAP